MRSVDKTLKDIRPKLRLVAPLTYYTSWGFAIFNISVAAPLFRLNEERFLIVGVVSLKIWALAFMLLGVAFAYSLLRNDWRATRGLMLIGVAVKTAWFLELLMRATSGKGFILVAIWGLITYLQGISYLYFVPVESRNGR